MCTDTARTNLAPDNEKKMGKTMDHKTNKLSVATKTLIETELREIAALQEIIQRSDLVGINDPHWDALCGLVNYARERLVEIEARLPGE